MTPFGKMMRSLRAQKKLTLQDQAAMLGVSSAYISALEHGRKGRPSAVFVDQICVWMGLIWDDAEALKTAASLSHPKPVIDATSLSPDAIALANRLAQNLDRLSDDDCAELSFRLSQMLARI